MVGIGKNLWRSPCPSLQSYFSSGQSLTCTRAWVYSSPRCRILHLPLLNFVRFPFPPTLQLVQVSLTAPWCASHSYFSIMRRFLEDTFCPFIQVIGEDIEQVWTQYWHLGNTTRYRSPARLFIDDHNILRSGIQPVLNLPHSPLI